MFDGTFLGVYSLVAVVTLAFLAWSYQAMPATAPLYPVGNALWAVVTVVIPPDQTTGTVRPRIVGGRAG